MFFIKTINRKETYTNILNLPVTVNNSLFLHRQINKSKILEMKKTKHNHILRRLDSNNHQKVPIADYRDNNLIRE